VFPQCTFYYIFTNFAIGGLEETFFGTPLCVSINNGVISMDFFIKMIYIIELDNLSGKNTIGRN